MSRADQRIRMAALDMARNDFQWVDPDTVLRRAIVYEKYIAAGDTPKATTLEITDTRNLTGERNGKKA